MAHWLVKQEPSSYSYPRLEKDRRTRWDGVHNPAALLHLRAMRPGDEAFFYHSGDERACVGILRVVTEPRPDPDDDRRSWFVDVVPVRALDRPVSLAAIRADPAFAGFELLRQSRLSVLPVPDAMWDRILQKSGPTPHAATAARRDRARAASPPRPRASARRTR
jgi:predicted RNA-binding protein with PUA-like domain